MSDFHILSVAEVDSLLATRYASVKNMALEMLKHSGTSVSVEQKEDIIRQLMRALFLAQNYNAFSLLPVDEINKNINNLKQLKALISEFRRKAHVHQQNIHSIVKKGLELRQKAQPTYPAFLEGKERVYVRIPSLPVGDGYVHSVIDSLNDFLPDNETLILKKYQNIFLISSISDEDAALPNKGIKVGRFFQKIVSDLKKIKEGYENNTLLSFKTRQNFEIFFNDCKSYDEYYNGYRVFKQNNPDVFPRSCLSRTSFYCLKTLLTENIQPDFFSALKESLSFFEESSTRLHDLFAGHHNTMSDFKTIDTLVFSKQPTDISVMSAYTLWEKNVWGGCMVPGAQNACFLPQEIGYGTVVVYGINSQQPHERLLRVNLKPYRNKNNDIYWVPNYIYGYSAPSLRDKITTFLAPYQGPKEGMYKIDSHLYADAEAKAIYFNMNALDILREQRVPFTQEENGNIVVPALPYKSVEEMMFAQLTATKPIDNAEIDIDMYGISPDVTFKEIIVNRKFSCHHLGKSNMTVLPPVCAQLELRSPNIHNFEGMDMNVPEISVLFTNRLRSLKGFPASCKKVRFADIEVLSESFQMPETLNSVEIASSTLNVGILDMSVCEHVSLYDSDFRQVKKLCFSPNVKSVDSFGTRFAQGVSFNFPQIQTLSFYCNLGPDIQISEWNVNPNAKRIDLFGCTFPKGAQIDLSGCKAVAFSRCDLSQISRLRLPNDISRVSMSQHVRFPDGVLLEDVLKNRGFNLPITHSARSYDKQREQKER